MALAIFPWPGNRRLSQFRVHDPGNSRPMPWTQPPDRVAPPAHWLGRRMPDLSELRRSQPACNGGQIDNGIMLMQNIRDVLHKRQGIPIDIIVDFQRRPFDLLGANVGGLPVRSQQAAGYLWLGSLPQLQAPRQTRGNCLSTWRRSRIFDP